MAAVTRDEPIAFAEIILSMYGTVQRHRRSPF